MLPMNLRVALVELNAKADRLIQLAKVDLGETREYTDWDAIPCSEPTRPKKKVVSFPSMRLYHTPADLSGVPEAGKATVEYKIVSRTHRIDADGKKTNDYEIEIQSLDPKVDPKDKNQPTKGKTANGAPAMGKAVTLGALRPRMIQFDGRARDQMGQYSQNDGGTLTPEQTTAAYGHPQVRAQTPQGNPARGQAILQRAIQQARGDAAVGAV